MGDAVGPQRRHERSGDVVLPDDLLEGVGAVAAVQSGGHGPSLIGRADPMRGTGRVEYTAGSPHPPTTPEAVPEDINEDMGRGTCRRSDGSCA